MTEIKTKRPSWDQTWMNIAVEVSKRSVCRHFKVGAVFVRDKRILTVGYNGPPRNSVHCCDVGCAKEDERGNRLPSDSGLCRGCHAEMNAIVNAAANSINLSGSTVYCTLSPCIGCAKHLFNLPIAEFVYLKIYSDEDFKKIEREFQKRLAEVKLRQFTP